MLAKEVSEIFFCAGKISEIAGALSDTTEMGLDTSTDGEDDGPDARQRRRERREVKKLMVESKNLLDVEEDDAGDNQSAVPAITSEVSEPQPPPPPAQVAEASGSAATAPGSGADETAAPPPGTSQNFINVEIVAPKIVLKPPIEISKFNIGTEANQNGAEVQLRASSANPSGADGGGAEPLRWRLSDRAIRGFKQYVPCNFRS